MPLFQFTTYEYDTVLDKYFAQYRMYDSKNKRFTAVDPVKSGLNWYEYCGSNPVLYTDPLGLYHVVKNGNGSFGAVDNVFFWVDLKLPDGRTELSSSYIRLLTTNIYNAWDNLMERNSSVGRYDLQHDITDQEMIGSMLSALDAGLLNGFRIQTPHFAQEIEQLKTLDDPDAGGLCWLTCTVMIDAYINNYNYSKEEADARIYYLATRRSETDRYRKDYWNAGGDWESANGLYDQGLISFYFENFSYGQMVAGAESSIGEKQASMFSHLLEQLYRGYPVYASLTYTNIYKDFLVNNTSGGHAIIISGYFELGGEIWLIIDDPQDTYIKLTKFTTLANSSIINDSYDDTVAYRGRFWWQYSGIVHE